MKNENLHFKML